MDTFMDKLAQKFTAQEMIKANAAAEAEEMDRLKLQVQEYTECLNRMQRLCDEMGQTAEAARGKVDAAQFNADELKAQLLEIRQNIQTMQSTRSSEEVGGYSAANRIAEQIDDIITTQTAQMERLKGMLAEQLESIRGLQQTQLESMQGLQRSQLDGLKGLQDAQFETVKNSLDDQLDSMRTMVKAQVSGIKSGQESQLDNMRRALEQQSGTLETQLGEMKANLETQLSGANEFVHKECVKVYRNVQAVVGEENNKQNDNMEYLVRPVAEKVKKVFNVSAAALVISLIGVVLQVLSMLHII